MTDKEAHEALDRIEEKLNKASRTVGVLAGITTVAIILVMSVYMKALGDLSKRIQKENEAQIERVLLEMEREE